MPRFDQKNLNVFAGVSTFNPPTVYYYYYYYYYYYNY
jgi:hypothetical protein